MGTQNPILASLNLRRAAATIAAVVVAAGVAATVLALPGWAMSAIVFASSLAGLAGLAHLLQRANASRRTQSDRLGEIRERGHSAFAIYDRETGLAKDWYFRLRLQEEAFRSDRSGQAFALLIVEAARRRNGPKSRKRLFDCMANTFRRADIVGRLDDLRFAVLLTATGPVGARAARRRVLDSLPRGFVRTGLACYPRDGQDWRELLRAAGATPGEIFAASSTDWERGGSSLFDGPSEEVEAA